MKIIKKLFGSISIDFLTRKSQRVLKEHGFDPHGVPRAACAALEQIKEPLYGEEKALRPARAAVGDEMGKKGCSAVAVEPARETLGAKKTDEPALPCVSIHLDDVGVKEQKQHRNKKGVAQKTISYQKDTANSKRPMVQNTVAHLKNANRCFTLTGRSVAEV